MTISDDSVRKYTLVVSQYEKSTTIDFTLRVYSTLPFNLRRIGDPYKYKQEITNASWRGQLAGGCSNNPSTYPNNPRFQFKADSDCQILVELKAPKEFQIGFDILCVIATDPKSPRYFKRKSSGSYRPGFVVLPLDLTAGTYDIVPSTFKPGQESAFFLNVRSNIPIKVSRLQ